MKDFEIILKIMEKIQNKIECNLNDITFNIEKTLNDIFKSNILNNEKNLEEYFIIFSKVLWILKKFLESLKKFSNEIENFRIEKMKN